MSKAKLTLSQFNDLSGTLQMRLTDALQKEIEDCALPELGGDSSTDLWNPPKVDSKTVVKLSPVVKELTGSRLDPAWIRKGGYLTVADAVTHVVAQIKTHGVTEQAPPIKAKKETAAVAT